MVTIRTTMTAMKHRTTGPQLTPIKNGWAALGHGWAVVAPSRDEALDRYREAERKHQELRERDATAASPSASAPPSSQSPNGAQG
jgi:hypothetical protein